MNEANENVIRISDAVAVIREGSLIVMQVPDSLRPAAVMQIAFRVEYADDVMCAIQRLSGGAK